MSTAEILDEIPKLTQEERDEIRRKLDDVVSHRWLDGDDPLSDGEKAILEQRIRVMEEHPEKSIPWVEAEARLKARYGE
jgi:hypothetical protein